MIQFEGDRGKSQHEGGQRHRGWGSRVTGGDDQRTRGDTARGCRTYSCLTVDYHYHYSYSRSGATDSSMSEPPLRSVSLCALLFSSSFCFGIFLFLFHFLFFFGFVSLRSACSRFLCSLQRDREHAASVYFSSPVNTAHRDALTRICTRTLTLNMIV